MNDMKLHEHEEITVLAYYYRLKGRLRNAFLIRQNVELDWTRNACRSRGTC